MEKLIDILNRLLFLQNTEIQNVLYKLPFKHFNTDIPGDYIFLNVRVEYEGLKMLFLHAHDDMISGVCFSDTCGNSEKSSRDIGKS